MGASGWGWCLGEGLGMRECLVPSLLSGRRGERVVSMEQVEGGASVGLFIGAGDGGTREEGRKESERGRERCEGKCKR